MSALPPEEKTAVPASALSRTTPVESQEEWLTRIGLMMMAFVAASKARAAQAVKSKAA